ncbi:heme lyase NrfEFG subunit NrfE [Aeromonas rivipollensis]|uniref:heme lyase NrfEFG subunit NrfE n=1 Tax=Aeromonas rivipollensis TaxID=948519 RepID=UPI00259E824D|nr:heme lyase NrfEFG subunit NrfE [Aeromonas rivipollensis]MDM5083994.1 heme lyase NrfEFG subunit NrfE [Aeromonas rivipollensis]MDM5097694.1 heme lyase NrfEFG subunit NrfE [Aeromonas rivipollensis]MDM5104820.1 heme lyase NrfEFG subunit NrfE [Aeromonas rivipollensis]
MLAELGYLSLLLATALSLLQGTLPWLGLRLASPTLLRCAKPLALLNAALLGAALGLLASCFARDDFTISYVAQHANSALPMGFKLAAVWGGHEGSMLFFVFALALWGALVGLCSKRVDPLITTRVLAIMGLIVGLFALYTLIFSSPFDRQFPGPLEGRDLNPMLQDIGLIIHPPLLYLGYVGFAVNFAFAMAALHSGRLDGALAHWSRPWALGSWVFLTAGILLGSWWAYYELGWGGWWFWDPVENASLLPWLLGTALLHALIVCEKRGAYGHGVLLLSIFTFALSLLGTFVVRSGVLTSVHAFAVDPNRGLTLLLLLGLLLTTALTLFALRADTRAPYAHFGFWSKEGLLGAAILLLSVACACVLLGTFYPMVFQSLHLGSLSVGAPYFNAVFVPLALVLMALMTQIPRLRWQGLMASSRLKILLPPLFGLLGGGLLSLSYREQGTLGWSGILANMISLWLIASLLINFSFNIHGLSANRLGSLLAHLGVAVCALGIAQVSHHSQEGGTVLAANKPYRLGAHEFRYEGSEPLIGPNYTAERITVSVHKDGREVARLAPERRHYSVRTMNMNEPGIQGGLFGDLYVVLGEKMGPDAYAMRLHHKPLVRWIWLGGLLMMAGGALRLLGRKPLLAAQPQTSAHQVAGLLPKEAP